MLGYSTFAAEMKRFPPASIALVIACAAMSLDTAAYTQQVPTFRSGVEIITLEVTVVDKDGKPVKGLKADDFVVTLEGDKRPVRTVDYLEFGGGTELGPEPARRQTSNTERVETGPGKRLLMLLIDDLSFRPGPAKQLGLAGERMLASLGPLDSVGVMTTSGAEPMLNPTTDRAAVVAALKKILGKNDDGTPPFYIAVQEAVEIEMSASATDPAMSGRPGDTLEKVASRECPLAGFDGQMYETCKRMIVSSSRNMARNIVHRAASQMSAYRVAIDVIRPFQGHKVLMALSAGVATNADVSKLATMLDPIMQAAAAAGVRFYSMTDIPEMVNMAEASSFERERARREEGSFLFSGVQTIASAAGGEAFRVIGQPDRLAERIVHETSALYRIGVESPVLQDKKQYLNAKVTMKPSGLTVRVNKKALSAAVEPENIPTEQRLRNALTQGGVVYGVPVAVGTALRRDPAASGLQLGINVQVPASAPGPVVAMFGLVNDAGQVVKAGRKEMPAPGPGQDYLMAVSLPAIEGRYRLRLAVADAKGSVGSVEQNVATRLQTIGSFTASELFTSWTGADGTPRFLALETLPAGAKTMTASLELYPLDLSAAPADLAVRIALVPLGKDAAVAEKELKPSTSGLTVAASADFPVGDLPAGSYTVRATVVEGGAVKGTITTLIRKTAG
jgi:VWFA-related protein